MDEHPQDAPRLTGPQQAAIYFARRDLEQARAEDLAALDTAGLILLVERLRNRLHSVLQVVDEVTPGASGDAGA